MNLRLVGDSRRVSWTLLKLVGMTFLIKIDNKMMTNLQTMKRTRVWEDCEKEKVGWEKGSSRMPFHLFDKLHWKTGQEEPGSESDWVESQKWGWFCFRTGPNALSCFELDSVLLLGSLLNCWKPFGIFLIWFSGRVFLVLSLCCCRISQGPSSLLVD